MNKTYKDIELNEFYMLQIAKLEDKTLYRVVKLDDDYPTIEIRMNFITFDIIDIDIKPIAKNTLTLDDFETHIERMQIGLKTAKQVEQLLKEKGALA